MAASRVVPALVYRPPDLPKSDGFACRRYGSAMAEVRVKLDHCVIAVSDWERSTEFYRHVLGAEVVDHPDGRVAYRFGDQQLNVHGPGLDIPLCQDLVRQDLNWKYWSLRASWEPPRSEFYEPGA
jgi:Glyoxalase/Bleomycin resistance protein/Dioxygenase superfamily